MLEISTLAEKTQALILGLKTIFSEPKMPILIGSEQRETIVREFVTWHNEANGDTHERGEHEITTNYFYSDSFLPCLAAIHQWALENNNETALTLANTALTDLRNAFSYFRTLANGSLYTITLADLIIADAQGDSDEFHGLRVMFREARTNAVACIASYAAENIELDSSIPVPRKEFKGNFKAVAHDALREYLETNEGVPFPEIYSEELTSAEIVCIALDWNSIFNEKETDANSMMRFLVDQRIRKIRHTFKQKFPEKQIIFFVTSGRHALYTWAVAETLVPLEEIRQFGQAENGGIQFNPSSGESQIIIPFTQPFLQPQLWETTLTELRDFILHTYDEKKPRVEPKQTMLSLKIAKKASEGGDFLSIKTDADIKNIVKDFIYLESANLQNRIEALIRDVQATPELMEKILNDNEVFGYTGVTKEFESFWKTKIKQRLQSEQLPESEHIRQGKTLINPDSYLVLREIKSLLQQQAVIEEMENHLIVSFNPTAGFVDIHHRWQNKFTGLFNALPNDKNVLALLVGDSTSDVPDTKKSPRHLEEKIRRVYIFGPDNASKVFRQAAAAKKERAFIAARSSILGLFDILLGLQKTIENY